MRRAVFLFFCYFISEIVWANDFSAAIRNVQITDVAGRYKLNADIDYVLSPIAKEALQKGISLTWTIIIKTEKIGFLWNSQLSEIRKTYQIKNHALLNLYSVKQLNSGEKDMFSTLTSALDFISKIRGALIVDKYLIQFGQQYRVAIKVKFEREALPVPIRPFSYFDPQWALSSQWMLWPIEN